MKHLINLLFLISITLSSQESIKASLKKKMAFDAESLISTNDFGTSYFIKNNVFYKKTTNKDLSYNNFQLGEITSANTFNSLKLNLFYKDFNTVIILDNRLAEILKIDFNIIQPYKNISHVSNGFDKTLWLFNQDSQQLELYDYSSNTTRARTQPIQSNVLDLKSNYNTSWLLTKEYLFEYNYFGNLIKKIKNTGYTELAENNGNIVLKRNNKLFYLKKDSTNIVAISLPNLFINQFFVTNESLYIYSNKTLHQFQLKID